MSESIGCLIDIYDAIKSLGESVVFLFTGLSFGIIPSVTNIEDEEDNVRFSGILANASQSFYSLYLMIMLIVVMFYDFNSVYSIIILSLSLFTSIWCIYLIKKRKNDEEFDEKGISGFPYFIHYICTIILVVKLLVTSHEVMTHILRNDTSSNLYVYLMITLCFEFFFLLTFTLVLFLPLVIVTGDKQEGKSTLTVWSMEYMDIMAHIAVCLTYAISVSSMTDYLTGYFLIYCLNVSVFTLFLPWTANANSFYPLIAHTLLLDIITDLPFTIITLAGKTYVGNLLIAIDIMMNIITFIRGVIWVPVKFKHDEVTTECMRKLGLGSMSTLKTLCKLSPVLLMLATFLTIIVAGAITDECGYKEYYDSYTTVVRNDYATLLIWMGVIGVTQTLFLLWRMNTQLYGDLSFSSTLLIFLMVIVFCAFLGGNVTFCIIGWNSYSAASIMNRNPDAFEELQPFDCVNSFEGVMFCVACAAHTLYAVVTFICVVSCKWLDADW